MVSTTTTKPGRGLTLIRRVYLARVIVLGLGFISVGSVLYEMHSAPPLWCLALLHCFVWPHIAYRFEARSSLRNQTAMRTLILDNLLVGFWMSAIQFNLLPSTAIAAMTSMSNVGVGGPRLLWRGTLAHAAGASVGILFMGLHWQPVSTHLNVVATLPLITLYPIAIGALTYQLATRLSQQRDRLEHVSKHDGLSGLLNRMHWETLVDEELARGQRQRTPAAIILTDIDFFKAINDRAGHAAGDEVIKGFADVLRANVREIDRAARYGGEEFAILLPNTTLPEAIDAAERLRSTLERDPLSGMRVTASFGVAALENEFSDHGQWVQCADTALYRAKEEGRNCVIAYPVLDRKRSA